jgi:uncharacterized Tic20 family protein
MNEATPQPTAGGGAGPGAAPGEDERRWAMFAHLSILVGGLLSSGWAGGIGYFVGPLIVWMLKRDTMPFVADQGREALNFALTVSLACLVLLLLVLMSFGVAILLALPLFGVIGIVSLVLVIIGAIKANEGVAYRYPISLRLVK